MASWDKRLERSSTFSCNFQATRTVQKLCEWWVACYWISAEIADDGDCNLVCIGGAVFNSQIEAWSALYATVIVKIWHRVAWQEQDTCQSSEGCEVEKPLEGRFVKGKTRSRLMGQNLQFCQLDELWEHSHSCKSISSVDKLGQSTKQSACMLHRARPSKAWICRHSVSPVSLSQ